MSEEVRFFLRTALYTALIGTIYWFVSYERAGSVLLAFLFAASVFFIAVVYSTVKASRGRAGSGFGFVRRTFGFDEPHGDAQNPLEMEEDVFPTGSIWPLALALGVTLIGLGLLYGAWLWIPGAGLTLTSGISWLTELSP